jgi:hypothetical protein
MDPLFRFVERLAVFSSERAWPLEIVEVDAPHTAHGCPFQAWSLRERLRMKEVLGR